MAGEWDLPTVHRKPRGDDAASPTTNDYERRPMLSQDERDNAERRKKRRNAASSFFSGRRLVAFVAVAGFLLGYYAQLLVFFLHVRVGFTGEILPTREVSLAAKFTRELIEDTKRVTFVSKKTNWDFLGFVASPHTVIFAHEDVHIPKPFDETLSIVRHSGVDSYMNLHNKTLTIMSHVHSSGSQFHFFKQDDEAVIYWPHYYQCMNQCKNLGTCYAGDMHVNVGDATNSNSYVFATGGSYFIGNELLKCILDKPVYVRLDGLDFGEDKTVGKMIHYNKCDVQIVSCKWFNNKEIYSPNAVVRMIKGATTRYIVEDTELLSQAQQEEKKKVDAAQEP
ncbi:hypothetical protein Poli38472_004539 [Pythium oligandrum]|uniref:Uncharacterized protein n=1 Tax=Pythium oligandrum TaxID=41045 RepID=A0A8K1CAF5_PYTOL|nr:hypothetical protein Poli38472_004539 [Pythium oligandrum]|eukprot:TMW59470.1 hypothetical protein Poli38472_004539 [Pythium oligandrum]